MYKFSPTRFLFDGDTDAAKNFIGPAKSQLEILKNQMRFQGLKQGGRRVWLNQDVSVTCTVNHGLQSCKIWVRPMESTPVTVMSLSYIYLLIVCDLESYSFKEILNSQVQDTSLSFDVFSAYDLFLDATLEDSGARKWSKVHGPLMVVVYISAEDDATWSFKVSYDGEEVTIPTNSFNYLKARNDHPCHIGFDIWVDDGVYYIGFLDEIGAFYIYSLQGTALVEEYAGNASGDHTYRYLVGYGNCDGVNMAWWSNLSTNYYEENLDTGTVTEIDIDGRVWGALWHPIARRVILCREYNYSYEAVDEKDNITYSLSSIVIVHSVSPITEQSTFYSLSEAEAAGYTISSTSIDFGVFTATAYGATDGPKPILHTETSYNVEYDQIRHRETYGDFLVGDDVYTCGTGYIKRHVTAVSEFTWGGSASYYTSFVEDDIEAVLVDAKKYTLSKWMWNSFNDSVSYELEVSDADYGTPFGGTVLLPLQILITWETSSTTESYGDTNLLSIASEPDEFPHIYQWSSILLSGTDNNEQVNTDWAIYRDSGNEDFFVITDAGVKYDLPDCDRAFFLQHEETKNL